MKSAGRRGIEPAGAAAATAAYPGVWRLWYTRPPIGGGDRNRRTPLPCKHGMYTHKKERKKEEEGSRLPHACHTAARTQSVVG